MRSSHQSCVVAPGVGGRERPAVLVVRARTREPFASAGRVSDMHRARRARCARASRPRRAAGRSRPATAAARPGRGRTPAVDGHRQGPPSGPAPSAPASPAAGISGFLAHVGTLDYGGLGAKESGRILRATGFVHRRGRRGPTVPSGLCARIAPWSAPTATTRTRSSASGRPCGPTRAPGRCQTPASPAFDPEAARAMCSRCCPTPRASPTWATSRTTRWATCWPTTGGATAWWSCTRWVTTPLGCRRRTTPSRPVCIRRSTNASIEEFRRQFGSWGISIDWRREFGTHEPRYYRWTQWIFLKLYEHGLAYRKLAPVKWCPKDQTVLANEQVIDGRCERCGTPVVSRQLEQWFFKITDYADRLLDDFELLILARAGDHDAAQLDRALRGRRGVFRCEDPAIEFPVFTTRPDTLFGATFFVMAPEHPDLERLVQGTGHEQEVAEYVQRALKESTEERADTEREKTGVFTVATSSTRSTARASRLRLRLRADGVRHRRGDGRAGARPARLRVRAQVRPRDPAGGRAGRRRDVRGRGVRRPLWRSGWSTPAGSTA